MSSRSTFEIGQPALAAVAASCTFARSAPRADFRGHHTQFTIVGIRCQVAQAIVSRMRECGNADEEELHNAPAGNSGIGRAFARTAVPSTAHAPPAARAQCSS